MRLKLLLVGFGAAFLLLTGFIPGNLPFNPGARFSDSVTSHWSSALYLRESVLEQGEFPVWRETIMAGAPFAANPLNKTSYPLQWLSLILPPAIHLDVLIVLHLFIAGVGMWRWTRTLGLRPEAAALSALAYAFAPRVVGHTGAGHLDLLYALAWFPWLMNAVVGHAAESKLSSVLKLAVLAALVFLADTRLSLFAFVTAGAYGVYLLIQTKRWNPLVWAVPAGALFLLLTASVTIPLLGWSPYLSRAGLMPQDAAIFSLQPAQFLGLVLPPQGGNVETLTYVGLPVLALAAVAVLALRGRVVFWLVLILLAAWYALGENGLLWSALVRIFPALLWFRVPSRAWFVVALVAPLLAGYGLHWLMERKARRTPRWRILALVGVAASLACGLFTMAALPLPDAAGWSIIIGGGGLSLLLSLLLIGSLPLQRFVLLILLVTFADLIITGRSWLEWRGESDWLTPYQPLADMLIEDGAARVYSPTYSLPQQAAEAFDIRLFGGVDPFQVEGVVAAVAQAGGVEQGDYSVVVPPLNDIQGDDPATANREAVPDTELLAEWDVSHVVAAYPVEQERLEPVSEIDGAFVYRNLDYVQPVEAGTLPRWHMTTPGLPDATTVMALNGQTVVAWIVAIGAFAVCLLILLFVRVRR